MKKILLLTSYRGRFYSSTVNVKPLSTMKVDRIADLFAADGYAVEIKRFSEVDLSRSYKGVYVLYTSSEDDGLYYKSYIEDIVLALKGLGAHVVPEYEFLRAHHNKVYMEILRKRMMDEDDRLLCLTFGSLEEFKASDIPDQQYVVKKASGAGSKGVALARDRAELTKLVEKFTRVPLISAYLREMKQRCSKRGGYENGSVHTNKVVIQEYIPYLAGDFKVLKYGFRYYVLYRKNRKGDFRASGGGRLTFDLPKDVVLDQLLDYADCVAHKIGTPLLSMDIAFDGKKFYLLEFQCLNFGPYAAEHSVCYHMRSQNGWVRINEPCDLERIFCEAIANYIDGDNG